MFHVKPLAQAGSHAIGPSWSPDADQPESLPVKARFSSNVPAQMRIEPIATDGPPPAAPDPELGGPKNPWDLGSVEQASYSMFHVKRGPAWSDELAASGSPGGRRKVKDPQTQAFASCGREGNPMAPGSGIRSRSRTASPGSDPVTASFASG